MNRVSKNVSAFRKKIAKIRVALFRGGNIFWVSVIINIIIMTEGEGRGGGGGGWLGDQL